MKNRIPRVSRVRVWFTILAVFIGMIPAHLDKSENSNWCSTIAMPGMSNGLAAEAKLED